MKFYRYKDCQRVQCVDAKFPNPKCTAWKNYEWDFSRYPEYETYLDFKTWLSFYKADTKGWYLLDKKMWSGKNRYVYIPYYHDSEKQCHFIKFINAHEYRKFKRWYRQHLKDKDSEENLQEQVNLAKLIRKEATREAEKAVKEAEKCRKELEDLVNEQAWKKAVYQTQTAGGKRK